MTWITHWPAVQQGWECPKCGGVYAPSMPMCTRCPQQVKTTTAPNTSPMAPHRPWRPNGPLTGDPVPERGSTTCGDDLKPSARVA